MRALVAVLVASVALCSCAAYQEPALPAYTNAPYLKLQSDRDMRSVKTRSARQVEFDRHQDSVQRRIIRNNEDIRKTANSALKTIGVGAALAAALRYIR